MDADRLNSDEPEYLNAKWQSVSIYPEPNWASILPDDVSPRQILGFNTETGRPESWPLRYGMGYWVAKLDGLPPGHYEVRVRAVDRNGFAQPDPRPQRKSGKNAVEVRRFQIV